MPYVDKYKANSDVFLSPVIDVGDVFLSVIQPELFDLEAKMYFWNSKDEEIRKETPGAYVESEEAAKKCLIIVLTRIYLK